MANELLKGINSMVEESKAEPTPTSNWKATKMASGTLHEGSNGERINEELDKDFNKTYRVGGVNEPNTKFYKSLDEAKASFNQPQPVAKPQPSGHKLTDKQVISGTEILTKGKELEKQGYKQDWVGEGKAQYSKHEPIYDDYKKSNVEGKLMNKSTGELVDEPQPQDFNEPVAKPESSVDPLVIDEAKLEWDNDYRINKKQQNWIQKRFAEEVMKPNFSKDNFIRVIESNIAQAIQENPTFKSRISNNFGQGEINALANEIYNDIVENYEYDNGKIGEGTPTPQVSGETNPAQALSQYLGEEVEQGWDDHVFDVGSRSYWVGTQEEAYQAAIEDVKSLIDDMGLELFTPSFQSWIMTNAIEPNFLDNYMDEEAEYMREEGDEDAAQYFESLKGKPKSIIAELENQFPDSLQDLLKDHVDWDKVAAETVAMDGIAHSLAPYDGDEIDLGNGLYAYRQN